MAKSLLEIGPTTQSDLPSLREVHTAAFPSDLESRLVELLITHAKATVSLKATLDDQTVGHILFSPVTVGWAEPTKSLASASTTAVSLSAPQPQPLGLAPLAVMPAFQRQGIGAALVRAGLAECKTRKVPWTAVLGDPAYYGRFGFTPARRFNLTCEFGGDDAFQILILDASDSPPSSGQVIYADEFRMVF